MACAQAGATETMHPSASARLRSYQDEISATNAGGPPSADPVPTQSAAAQKRRPALARNERSSSPVATRSSPQATGQRTPIRSTRRPPIGMSSAAEIDAMVMNWGKVARLQPRSLDTGSRNIGKDPMNTADMPAAMQMALAIVACHRFGAISSLPRPVLSFSPSIVAPCAIP
jgi:hypothetical protein